MGTKKFTEKQVAAFRQMLADGILYAIYENSNPCELIKMMQEFIKFSEYMKDKLIGVNKD